MTLVRPFVHKGLTNAILYIVEETSLIYYIMYELSLAIGT